MQLYYSSISNYCSKVKLLIKYKKIDIEFLSPPGGYGSDEFKKISPQGTIPTIGTRFSVFPMSSIEGTSEGLKYPIDNLVLNPTKKIGTSNEVVSNVKLSFNHRSAIIILPKKYLTNVLEVL